MTSKGTQRDELGDGDGKLELRGAQMLMRVFPMLAGLAKSGTERDRAGNRRLLYSHYAALVLVGLFNPILNSARALVAASKLNKVQLLTGGSQVSLGSFSEASAVFEPQLLAGIVKSLLNEVRQRRFRRRLTTRIAGQIPGDLVERLVAVDGSILTALPQVAGRLGALHKGQWRLHAQVRVADRTCLLTTLTQELSTGSDSERNILAQYVDTGDRTEETRLNIPSGKESHLFLLDRGYRSAELV